jgi:hypothetical protein
MNIAQAAEELISELEQSDSDEYTFTRGVKHINQAIFELCEVNEFNFQNAMSAYTLETPESGSEPEYWTEFPGRVPLTTALETTWAGFSYIKRSWLDVSGEQSKLWREYDLEELLDKFGDDEGVPQGFAIEGEYIWWRPIAPAGTDYVSRWRWQKMYETMDSSAEPILLAQCPYGVIYKAASIASIWLLDDNRVPMFEKLSEKAFELYSNRHSMTADAPERAMEEFNG